MPRHAFLYGLLIGSLLMFPLFILAEHVRYGFISTWWVLWIIFLIPATVGFGLQRGTGLPYIWRMIFFFEYALIGIILMMRILHLHGSLLAISIFTSVYLCYAIFADTKKISFESDL